MHDGKGESLALTARWTAGARAVESAREDRLFCDPWAPALAGPEGMEWVGRQGGGGILMAIRTRYFDDFLQEAAFHLGLRQVVILAAGLDTRAYRLPWPESTSIFELDQDLVLRYKESVLAAAGAQPACQRTAIATDLTGAWQSALQAAGFNPAEAAVWLLEGFLFYLPGEDITRILGMVSALSAPGSRLGFDVVNNLTLTSPMTSAWVAMQARAGAAWLGGLDDPEGLLAEMGWQANLTQPGAPDAHFDRWTLPVIPVKMPNMPHQWYVTASRLTT